jgi:hypothetical protein
MSDSIRSGFLTGVLLLVLGCAPLSAIEPEAVRSAVEVAETERPLARAISVEIVQRGESPILVVELDDGTNIEIATSDFSVVRTNRPLFARRQRRVGRAVDSIAGRRIGLAEAYERALAIEDGGEISASRFVSVAYLYNRERLLVRVDFADFAVFLNPRTGDIVDP